MHLATIVATALAVVPSALAQLSTKAVTLAPLNGFYSMTSVRDGRYLAFNGQSLEVQRDSNPRASTFYINSGTEGYSFIAGAQNAKILTGTAGQPTISQVQGLNVYGPRDTNRNAQIWKINKFDDNTYEIQSGTVTYNGDNNFQVLDVRGGDGPQAILWSRNVPASSNQRWNITPFSITG